MSEQKEFMGITQNECSFQGKVDGDPTEVGDFIFMTLRTQYVQKDPNGQFVRIEQEIPLMVEPGGPTNVVKKFVMDGRKILVRSYFKTWEADGEPQMAFVVKHIELGSRPYNPEQN
jgi:hypothetical protein